MKILTVENSVYDLDYVPEEIEDIRYCVFDVTDKKVALTWVFEATTRFPNAAVLPPRRVFVAKVVAVKLPETCPEPLVKPPLPALATVMVLLPIVVAMRFVFNLQELKLLFSSVFAICTVIYFFSANKF